MKNEKKQLGRIGLSMAINYFTLQGYTVSLPLNDTQWYDLIIEKNNIFQTVQCKATQTLDNKISLRNMGGTKGIEYDNILNHQELEYLFCVNKDLDMWLIPVKDITVKTEITLSKEIHKNNQGFQTYKYYIK